MHQKRVAAPKRGRYYDHVPRVWFFFFFLGGGFVVLDPDIKTGLNVSDEEY